MDGSVRGRHDAERGTTNDGSTSIIIHRTNYEGRPYFNKANDRTMIYQFTRDISGKTENVSHYPILLNPRIFLQYFRQSAPEGEPEVTKSIPTITTQEINFDYVKSQFPLIPEVGEYLWPG